MRSMEENTSWVVYHAILNGSQIGMNAVCEQHEWEAMVSSRPGQYTLVQAGMTNEGQAERLARGTSGDPKVRGKSNSATQGNSKGSK